MICTGKAHYVGCRTGEKNGKTWMNVFLDDPENPLQRLQVFVPVDLQSKVSGIPVGSSVIAQLRVTMRQTDSYPAPSCSLTAIQLEK